MQIDYQQVDQKQLARDIDEIKKQIGAPTFEDFRHLKKVELWGRAIALLGYSMAWIFPFNILGAFLISTGNICRWANVAHPILHGAYDKVPGIPERYTSKGFAQGWWRRLIDWLDWIEPSAWDYEHNKKHHYNLGEAADPDNIETNMEWLRQSNWPVWLRYAFVIAFSTIWKPAFYAPNTLDAQANAEKRRRGEPENFSILRRDMWNPFAEDGFRLWVHCFLPYVAFRFILIPLLFLPLGMDAVINVLLASVLAEFITNVHSFFVILPSHAAEDIYRFDEPGKGRGEFYLRQIIGTVNYNTGSDHVDFLHGWLNYQVEHHLFPALPLNHYQEMQPKIKEICARHNLPYRQESVFKRLWMTIELMAGKTDQLLIKHT